ncbi:4607_t:CDS:2 [Gigaspora rosea]|nr:4607_t:CDS:2 [Gigaspora rosea]
MPVWLKRKPEIFPKGALKNGVLSTNQDVETFYTMGEMTIGLEFKEGINYTTPGVENPSFTWNQTWWDSSINNGLSFHMDINSEEWA